MIYKQGWSVWAAAIFNIPSELSPMVNTNNPESNREINKGTELNKQTDMMPVCGMLDETINTNHGKYK